MWRGKRIGSAAARRSRPHDDRARVQATLLAVAFLAAAPNQARALNEDVMRNILSPIFLARNLSAVCIRLDGDFEVETKGRTGGVAEVTKHMEDQLMAGMTRDQAAPIVVAGAGHARAVGLGLIRALSGGSVEEQSDRLKRLCERTAKPLIREVIEGYEARPEFFQQMIKDARRG